MLHSLLNHGSAYNRRQIVLEEDQFWSNCQPQWKIASFPQIDQCATVPHQVFVVYVLSITHSQTNTQNFSTSNDGNYTFWLWYQHILDPFVIFFVYLTIVASCQSSFASDWCLNIYIFYFLSIETTSDMLPIPVKEVEGPLFQSHWQTEKPSERSLYKY